jgi:hypothetical protein
MKRTGTLILPLMLLLLACGRTPLTGGSGSEGEARVRGCVVYAGSALPAISTWVRLRADSFLKDTSSVGTTVDAVTDSNGRFVLDSVDTGSYSIEVNDGNGCAVLIRCHIICDTMLPVDTLRPTGAINGTWETLMTPQAGYFVQVYGLDRAARVDPVLKTFFVSDVPAGTYSLRLVSSSSGSPSRTFNNVQVSAGRTVSLALSLWSSSKRLYLNTTPLGADVPGSVYDFPVLVRLTTAVFTFAQAKAGGADLRFTKADNTVLPYEIERWDAVNQLAELWVKVDTVFGDDSAQFITMYWGNPDALDSSDGAAVFDTAHGFSGVWHLCENGDSIYDATGNAFKGENSGSTVSLGIIGNSRNFTDGNHIRISGLLNRPSDITLSAWVWSDTSAGRGQDIVSIGDAALIRFDDVSGVGTAGFYHNNPVVNDSMYGRVGSGRYLAKTGWHYLAFSINSASHVQTFYIDGVECANTQDVNPIYYAGLGTDTYIGIHGNGKTAFNFIGQIDEVRVNNISVAPDWVKLCYMNQKAQDALIKW